MYPLPQRIRNRTHQTVENDAVANSPKTLLPDAYLTCRYFPFNSKMNSKIPDGRGRNVITRDFRTTYNIDVANLGYIRISPVFPNPVTFGMSNGFSVNGVPFGLTPVHNGLAPNVEALSLLSTPIPNGAGTISNDAVSGRITTVGYRLYYIGKLADALGVIVVDEVPFSVTKRDSVGPLVTQRGFGVDTSAKDQTAPANKNGTVILSRSPFSTIPTKTRKTFRPEQGLQGVIKANSNQDAHTFKAWDKYGSQMQMEFPWEHTYEEVHSVLCSQSAATSPAEDVFYLTNLVDDHFDETLITLIGAGFYRLEVVICLETEITQSSELLPFAAPSPVEQQPVLKLDTMLNQVAEPVALADNILPLVKSMTKLTMGRQRRRKIKQPVQKSIKACPQSSARPPGKGKSRSAKRRRNKRNKAATNCSV